ncbi:PD-(D/E)XK nuclease domain-containing protein [Hippea maritima]|uniref:PD-(D/E)XK nuclease domain-containing protein n=1 Tax=Hippea maritima TaxID=84405 RepID=UPI0002F14699|nr:PD-(D/E)XK nuclease domain-containing protein [Hippea maritima]
MTLTGLKDALRQNDFTSFINHLKTIFATIPYTNYANNILSKYEGYYSSVIFVYLMALGYDVIPEDITNKGRIDLTIKTKDKIVIIEFKVDQEKDKPISQIRKRKYYEKYLDEKKDIYLVGMVFDSGERNIGSWRVEEID